LQEEPGLNVVAIAGLIHFVPSYKMWAEISGTGKRKFYKSFAVQN
jgi:hypothetical protein